VIDYEKVVENGRALTMKRDILGVLPISEDESDALLCVNRVKLNTLTCEFDAMLTRMQRSAARSGMKSAFDASPKRLGTAAVAAGRKIG
jgi:hypothetical protein